MPDGHSDSAIDFYASAYCREMLDSADPTRFSKERLTYSNDIFTGFRSHVWASNTNDEIADGHRLAGTRRIPLARLADGSRPYGRLLHNMLRPFGRRECKDHYLTTYPDDRPVSFTIFDFDRHPPKGRKEPLSVESDEWLAIDDAFWRQVSAFHGLAERLDLDVMWVQSPGRWLVDGHHLPCRMFGLYAVIRHEPRTPSELRPTLAALKDRVGLDVETSWDTRHRNIRIPGQCFLDVCSVDPARRSIIPIRDAGAPGERDRNMARLVATVDGYAALNRRGGERLLGLGARLLGDDGEKMRGVRSKGGTPPEGAAKGLVTSPSGEGRPPAVDSPGIRQGLVTSSRRRSAAIRKSGSGSAREANSSSDNTDAARWRREPDTFRALHESGLLRRALREHGWNPSRVDEAVEWAAPRLRSLRPASSATCSDDKALTAFLRKHYLWGCKTYDPAKARASARARARIADEARIAPSLRLDDTTLRIYLKGVVGLSDEEMKCIRRFRALERRHAGRIACRTLYAAFGGQRRYQAFQARHGILSISQEHSQSVGRCRQWTLAPRVIRSVRMLMDSPVLLFMVRGERDRERVIYTETHRRKPHHRRRTVAIHPARKPRHALESVTVTLSARGPPPKSPKTHENAMFGMSESAKGARRHGERAVAA